MSEIEKAVEPVSVPDGRLKDSFGNDLIERELVSIVLRMTRFMPDDKPAAKKLHEGAIDYLRRKNLLPSPLRANETIVQSSTDLREENAALRETLEKLKRMAMLLRGDQAYREFPKAVLNAVADALSKAREGKQ